MTDVAHKLMTGLFLICLFNAPSFADKTKLVTSGAVSLPPANTGNPPPLDCAKSAADPRCRPSPPPNDHPRYHPHAVIINQAPAQPALEVDSLSTDWEGCRKAKREAMRTRDAGDIDQANRLDEWLWKNCRTYSDELRQMEQNDM